MTSPYRTFQLNQFPKAVRRSLIVIWSAVIALCIGAYLSDPTGFSSGNIAHFLESLGIWVWAGYFAFSILRGFTLLPSTPVVLAGTLLFPSQPWAVLAVSLIGILVSSTMIYYFSEFLGFDEYFESHKPELTHKIKVRLERPLGFVFVALWAFFPFVPTDLVCYLAGTTRMNFAKFISAIMVGEALLCSFYVFTGGSLFNYLGLGR